MFGIQNYSSFVAAIIAFQLIPGPGTLAILNATARHGVRSGMGAVLGTLAGDLLYMLGATLGLAAVLAARPVIMMSLHWAGIAYLCWLGLRLLLAPVDKEGPDAPRPQDRWAAFRQALAVCLANPKAILFFLAFFPLFLTPDSRPSTLGAMMLHVSLISLIYQAALVFVGNAAAVRLRRFRPARGLARRLVGLGLVGFGIRLALARR